MFPVSHDFSMVYRQLVVLKRINVRQTTFLLPENVHAILKPEQKQTASEAHGYINQ